MRVPGSWPSRSAPIQRGHRHVGDQPDPHSHPIEAYPARTPGGHPVGDAMIEQLAAEQGTTASALWMRRRRADRVVAVVRGELSGRSRCCPRWSCRCCRASSAADRHDRLADGRPFGWLGEKVVDLLSSLLAPTGTVAVPAPDVTVLPQVKSIADALTE